LESVVAASKKLGEVRLFVSLQFWSEMAIGPLPQLPWHEFLSQLLQYCFLLRVPLLAAALMIVLPFLSTFVIPAMLRNLFVLRQRWELALITGTAIFTGMGIVTVLNILLRSIPDRFQLVKLFELSPLWQYLIALGLGLFIAIPAAKLSYKENAIRRPFSGLLVGILAAIALLMLGDRFSDAIAASVFLKQRMGEMMQSMPEELQKGYSATENHLVAIGFLSLVLIIYFGVYLYGWRVYQPNQSLRKQIIIDKNAYEIPALFYLLIILLLLVLVFSGITFLLDYFRIPLLAFLLLFSVLNYAIFRVQHFYPLLPKAPFARATFQEVLNARLSNQDQANSFERQPEKNRSLVVICAAGGGIQAAGWTARVLTGLHEELGPAFTQAIGLVSSVSGGSVGTMYYLDALAEDAIAFEKANPLVMQQIFDRATQEGLDAVGWGLAYPDLWRIIGLPFLAPLLGAKRIDRGTAIETEWKVALKNPSASLASWSQKIKAGKLPIPVFNATVVENGSRLLISPLSFKDSPAKENSRRESLHPPRSSPYTDTRFRDFRQDYQDFDLNVATAARLSATFPYVSPVCRNHPDVPVTNYHVADGGYFDNNGIFTAVEWLDNCVLPHAKELGIQRVFFLEVLPFPKTEPASIVTSPGWLMTTLGPLLAAFKVRNYTVTARNTVDVGDLKKFWEMKLNSQETSPGNSNYSFQLEHFILQFPVDFKASSKHHSSRFPYRINDAFLNNRGDYTPPLSWKLTDVEKENILCAWDWVIANDREMKKLKKAWLSQFNS
jgi:hypothetical protein